MRLKDGQVVENINEPMSKVISRINGKGDSLTLSVEGEGFVLSVEALGTPDLTTKEFVTISGINKLGFDVVTEITEAGLYSFSIEGCYAIKINVQSVTTPISAWFSIEGE